MSVIDRTQATKALSESPQPEQTEIMIDANIIDKDNDIVETKLFYRHSKIPPDPFKEIDMNQEMGDLYRGIISSSEVTKGSIEYYLLARDQTGNIVTDPVDFYAALPYTISVENSPPVIAIIEPPTKPIAADIPIVCRARISDPDGDAILEPTLHWRPQGYHFYTSVPMTLDKKPANTLYKEDGDIYMAIFTTNDAAVQNSIEFYLTAKDIYGALGITSIIPPPWPEIRLTAAKTDKH